MPKVLLFALNSSYTHTNLAVRCIKNSLVNAGYECEIAEYSLKDKRRRILEALIGSDADIYGFSVYIWNAREMYAFAADIKKMRPDSSIVFGGPEVSFDADEILRNHPYIDSIITGEGEEVWVKLCAAYDDHETIPRIMPGGICENFSKEGIEYSEDELCGGSRVVYYESSRGCPYRCAYCLSAISGRVRAKSAEDTLDDMLRFEKVDHIKIIKFVDRTFNFDRERAKTIWRGLLDGKYTKNYHFEICAELLDEESFDILSCFPKGKIQLEIGVQSTNPETLRRVDRSDKTDNIISAIERLHKMGNMHIHADLIAGLPGETMSSFSAAFNALYGKCDMLQLGFLKLLRGSKLRREADSFGCVYSDMPPYEVMCTDTLTFGELCLLHDIDDVCDRYCTDAFKRSVGLIVSRGVSPFDTFADIADCFRRDGYRMYDISQPRAYELLYEYAHIGDDRELSELLTLDFLTSQKMSAPIIGGHELKRGEGESKREFMRFADANGIEYFAPALECRIGQREYIVDRRMMRAYTASGGEFVEI